MEVSETGQGAAASWICFEDGRPTSRLARQRGCWVPGQLGGAWWVKVGTAVRGGAGGAGLAHLILFWEVTILIDTACTCAAELERLDTAVAPHQCHGVPTWPGKRAGREGHALCQCAEKEFVIRGGGESEWHRWILLCSECQN